MHDEAKDRHQKISLCHEDAIPTLLHGGIVRYVPRNGSILHLWWAFGICRPVRRSEAIGRGDRENDTERSHRFDEHVLGPELDGHRGENRRRQGGASAGAVPLSVASGVLEPRGTDGRREADLVEGFHVAVAQVGDHVMASSFLNQDALCLHVQVRYLAKTVDAEPSSDSYVKAVLPVETDRCVLSFREWLARMPADGSPTATDPPCPSPTAR
ncbi:hypothetical protein ACHAWF_000830 [Thalassiosira exigua]